MNDWQSHVRRHLRERGLTLADAVVVELADHLEDAWDARPSPSAADDAGEFARQALQRADVPALARRHATPPPPVPEPGSGSIAQRTGRRAAAHAAAAAPGPGVHRRGRRRPRPWHRGHDRGLRAGLLGAAGAAPLHRRRSAGDGVGAQPHARPGPQRHQPRQLLRVVGTQHLARERGHLRAADRQPVGRRRRPRGAARRGGAAASARDARGAPAGRPAAGRRRRCAQARRRPSSSARGCGVGATVGPPMPSAAPW